MVTPIQNPSHWCVIKLVEERVQNKFPLIPVRGLESFPQEETLECLLYLFLDNLSDTCTRTLNVTLDDLHFRSGVLPYHECW